MYSSRHRNSKYGRGDLSHRDSFFMIFCMAVVCGFINNGALTCAPQLGFCWGDFTGHVDPP